MATFNIGDKVKYRNGLGRPVDPGIIKDINGEIAKIYYDRGVSTTGAPQSFYTYANVKLLEHYKEEK